MNNNGILNDIISNTVTLVIGSVIGGIVGIAKGKKKSSLAIERKNTVYQPLLDELIVYSDFKWRILEEIKLNHLYEIVNNNYKYGINDQLLTRCIDLINIIEEYSKINIINIAHSIIVDLFDLGFEEIYGSTVEGVIHHSDEDGNECDEEIMFEPLIQIRQADFSKYIKELLLIEGRPDDEVYFNHEEEIHLSIYSQLKTIYATVLNVRIDGKKNKLPEPEINLEVCPEEHIALNYDFFQKFNLDERVINKYKLREEIIYQCQSVIQELKEIIEKIVKIYEVEQI